MWMIGQDGKGNRIGLLEKQGKSDVWRGKLTTGQQVTAESQDGANHCLRTHGAISVYTVNEPIHLSGHIIAV